MRVAAMAFVWALLVPWSAAAQTGAPAGRPVPGGVEEWDDFTSLQDGFKINFPGKPRISETKWESQLNYTLPARVYSAEKGQERYSVTVVDYSGILQMGRERAKQCPPGNANCRENAPPALGPGYAAHDERGAIVYATFKMLQRDAKINYFAWEWQDMVEGHLLQLANADKSRTFAWIGMHEHKLYIVEGTVPAGYPEPGLFQQSLGWVDKDGNGIRYTTIYSNSYHGMGVYPKPTPAGRGGGAGGGGGAAGGRGGGAQ
jgi:hypothetical protein